MTETINKTNPAAQEDLELVKAFQAGDLSVFDRLVTKYIDKLINICYRILGHYEEANDCAQEIFVKTYHGLKNFRGEAAFSTWLYRICVTFCRNRLQSSSFKFLKNTPEQEYAHKEKQEFIAQAIGRLPADQREVIILCDLESLKYEEIAAVTGINIGTVRSKIARARQKLREELKELS